MSLDAHFKHMLFGGVLSASLSLVGLSVSAQMDPPHNSESCIPGGYMMVMGGIENPATVPDMEQARKYGPAVWDLVESYDAFYVLRKTPDVVYEGNWPDWKAIVISKWPCRETGLTFWNSDAYQNEIKPLREKAGAYEVGMFNPTPKFPPAENQDMVPASCSTPYLVITMSKVTDTDAYGRYTAAIRDTGIARRAGLQLMFSGQPQEVLEGKWPSDYNTMAMVFPCQEAWDAFYAGEPYVTDILPLRKDAGDFIIVGFEPERVE